MALAVQEGEGVALPVARSLVLVGETLGEGLAERGGVTVAEVEALRVTAPVREAEAQGVAEALREALALLDCVVDTEREGKVEGVGEAEAQCVKEGGREGGALGVPPPGEALEEREAGGLEEAQGDAAALREALAQALGAGLRVALRVVLPLALALGLGEALAQRDGERVGEGARVALALALALGWLREGSAERLSLALAAALAPVACASTLGTPETLTEGVVRSVAVGRAAVGEGGALAPAGVALAQALREGSREAEPLALAVGLALAAAVALADCGGGCVRVALGGALALAPVCGLAVRSCDAHLRLRGSPSSTHAVALSVGEGVTLTAREPEAQRLRGDEGLCEALALAVALRGDCEAAGERVAAVETVGWALGGALALAAALAAALAVSPAKALREALAAPLTVRPPLALTVKVTLAELQRVGEALRECEALREALAEADSVLLTLALAEAVLVREGCEEALGQRLAVRLPPPLREAEALLRGVGVSVCQALLLSVGVGGALPQCVALGVPERAPERLTEAEARDKVV